MTTSTPGSEPYVLFELAGTSYGVASRHILQIEMVSLDSPNRDAHSGDPVVLITPVPNAPPFVEGVALSRGQVLPALNLRARLGLPAVPHDLRTRLIVVKSGERQVGLIVDAAREFVTVTADRLQSPPETLMQVSGRFVEAVATLGERLILILDVARVVDPVAAAMAAQADA